MKNFTVSHVTSSGKHFLVPSGQSCSLVLVLCSIIYIKIIVLYLKLQLLDLCTSFPIQIINPLSLGNFFFCPLYPRYLQQHLELQSCFISICWVKERRLTRIDPAKFRPAFQVQLMFLSVPFSIPCRIVFPHFCAIFKAGHTSTTVCNPLNSSYLQVCHSYFNVCGDTNLFIYLQNVP